MNTLYYGDNLPILRQYLKDESVDLIYLDPPFNSNRSYNVLFKDEAGADSSAQITAFKDTWHWPQAVDLYAELVTTAAPKVVKMLSSLHELIGPSQILAYLVMMTARLVELHRVLKPTGSLYLHCDPTASHYLKMILDTIFGFENFRNEIIWKRTSARSDSHKWNHIHDVIFFYTKSGLFTWNTQYMIYDEAYVEKFYHFIEPETGRKYASDNLTAAGTRNGSSGNEWRGIDVRAKGLHWKYTTEKLDELDKAGRILWPNKAGGVPRYKRYLDEMPGLAIQSIIMDIPPLSAQSAEKLGYPTQKPIALLDRIIQASSNPGDVVLDPFCGCGTAIAAAHKLNRNWIGIDITHLSIALQKYRLQDSFGIVAGKDYQVIGEPEDLGAARQLAQDDRYQFQWWALSLVKARPAGSADSAAKTGKKGADQGIDGLINFLDDHTGKPKTVIIQVKSGKVTSATIRDLVGVITREKAAIGVLVTLEPASAPMLTEAAAAGHYYSPGWQQNYPSLQILTIEELLKGAGIQMPSKNSNITFKKAEKLPKDSGHQQGQLGF